MMSEKNTTQEKTEGDKSADKKEGEDKNKKEEEVVIKKARKVAPKFNPATLNDPEKGLEALYKKIDRLNPNIVHGDKESLSMLMRIYQQWLYQVFPADFGDMCWKISDMGPVKSAVRNFVFDKKGIERSGFDREIGNSFVDDDEAPQDEEAYKEPPQQSSRFLDDEDLGDAGDDIMDLLTKEQ
ncbi:hypothetical protein TRFO_25423 [Tritrichomonas foetus]|uniref:Chromosome segregation in meiosis protein 3 domain-containing protein n=1 Tax=Tritrichomonas foetus TaxID=1144522 RepID=A0A1J4K516_9EUKA|nr:hypothetical protein TRFO_25423 [Tritrichomonas foetus]|eukprot:OHT06537.1 hypothetical protein TRFO_25423 [Tritrichomonas foetus]